MLFSLFVCVVILFFTYAWHKNQFFKKLHINYLEPLPVFGNMFLIIIGRKHSIYLTEEAHAKFPKDKYVGLFSFFTPMILIKDINLAKQIFIKDFEHFVDHVQFTDEEVDPLFGKNLASLRGLVNLIFILFMFFFVRKYKKVETVGERWKEMRNTLSPAFTSSKMKGMFPLMIECIENVVNYIKKDIKNSENTDRGEKYVEFNTKQFTTYFANDVIASCAFGIKIDSLNDKKNDFYKFSKSFSDVTPIAVFKLLLFFFSPSILKMFKIELSDRKSTTFFRKLVKDNMETREKQNITRLDMIHLLMLAKKGSLIEDNKNAINDAGFAVVSEEKNHFNKLKKTQWTDDDLVAQALVFILAGFDTVTTLLSFAIHEIGINSNIQKKLYDEINSCIDLNKDCFEYGDLNKFKYLDMVVTETLRKWPPVATLDRLCVKTYNLPPQNESDHHERKIYPGQAVCISAYDIQRDPVYYPDPEKFEPERFSDENKANINSNTYMPFGVGPRACIGSRFALMEIKLFIIYILTHFELIPTPKTPNPLKIKPHLFNMMPEGDFWIGFKLRQTEK